MYFQHVHNPFCLAHTAISYPTPLCSIVDDVTNNVRRSTLAKILIMLYVCAVGISDFYRYTFCSFRIVCILLVCTVGVKKVDRSNLTCKFSNSEVRLLLSYLKLTSELLQH